MFKQTLKWSERIGNFGYSKIPFGNFDNPKNTTPDGKQIWLWISDSTPITNQSVDTAPEVFYANTVFYWNELSSLFTAVTSADIAPVATAGTSLVKFGTDYYKNTGYKIGFIAATSGGANFYPDGDTNNWFDYVVQFNNAIIETNQALAFWNLSEVRGVIIQNGINDARATQDLGAIRYSIYNLVDRINTQLQSPQCYFVNIGRDENGTGNGTRVQAVRSYIREVCSYNTNCHEVINLYDYITSPDIYSTSFADVHLTQFGLDFVGAKMVRNMLSLGLIKNEPRQYTYSTEALDVFRRLQGINEEEKRCIADFVDYLTSKSQWTALFDSFYFPFFTNKANCIQDWRRDGKQLRLQGRSRVLENRGGIETFAATDRVDCNFNPSTDGVNYTQNAAMIMAYVLKNNQATGANAFLLSCNAGGFASELNFSNSNNDIRWNVNVGTQGSFGIGNFKKNSLYIAYRSASNSNSLVQNYQSQPATSTSTSIPNQEFALGCRNVAGVYSLPQAGVYGPIGFGGNPLGPNTYLYKKIRELTIDFMVMRD